METDQPLGTLCITQCPPSSVWELAEQPQCFGHDPLFGIAMESLDNWDVALDLPWADHDAHAPLGTSEARPSLQLLHLQSFDFEAVAAKMDRHFEYAIGQIKHAPRTMLLETRTPGCHVSLYARAMPRAMQGEHYA